MEDTAKHPTVFDTDQQHLGDVYAKALLGFAENSGDSETLLGELEQVVSLMDELPKLRSVLESLRVPHEEKGKLLQTAFADKLNKDLLNFLKIVSRRGRFDCLGAIAGSARRMHDEMAGRVVALVTTAEAIDEATRDRVAEQLAQKLGKQVEIQSEVDPSIIGGMVVRVGDTVFDGSVVNQLGRIRTQAIKRASDAIRNSIDNFITN